MMRNDLTTFTGTAYKNLTFISSDTSATTDIMSKNQLWVNDVPAKTDKLVFWSPELIDEDALPPTDSIWTEIDAMLEKIWASDDIISIEDEELMYAEMKEISRISEMKRFEKLYGETDHWE